MNYIEVNDKTDLSQLSGKYIKYKCIKCNSDSVSQVVHLNTRFKFGLLCKSCYTSAIREINYNNPVRILTIDDFNSISLTQNNYIIFTCDICKKDFKQHFSKKVENDLRSQGFICQKCKIGLHKQDEFNYESILINEPIWIHSPEDILLKNYKYKQILKFFCKQCHKEETLVYRNDHRESYAELLCDSCKIKSRMLEKYGVENSFQLESTKEKSKQTCLEKYGTEFAVQSPEVQSKIKDTNLERYGVENASQAKSIIEKRTNTFLARYGKTCPPRTSIRNIFDGIQFDSSWEIIFYKYYKYIELRNIIREPCRLTYNFNNKIYNYYPDFEIDGKLYEIKGDHLLRKMKKDKNSKLYAKYKCMIANKVIIITQKDISILKKKLKKWEAKNQ